MITDIDTYFAKGCDRCGRFNTPACSALIWGDGLARLRQLCLGLGLSETVKWGHPAYTHAGRNIAVFGAFQRSFRLSFMNSDLLDDTDGILEPIGPNSRAPSQVTFTHANQVTDKQPVLERYLRQLMDKAEAGIKPPRRAADPMVMDAALTDALAADPDFSVAWDALTPGRKRSWCLHFNAAKQMKTRVSRVEKSRAAVLAGKGHNER